MKTRDLAIRVLAVWIYLFVVQAVLGMLITTTAAPPENAGPWFLLSNLLVALSLCLLANRSDWSGVRLAASVSCVPAIMMLTNLLEGFVFLTNTSINWPMEALRTCLAWILTMPLWPMLFPKSTLLQAHFRPIAARTWQARLGKFLLSALSYPVLYFVAGMIVFPFVREFYSTQTLPPRGLLFLLQLLVRGPVYIGLCILMTRMLGLARLPGALVVGAILATLNGIAPLIIPSSIFPDPVRFAHMIEITTSNLAFGFIVAWLWGPVGAQESRYHGEGVPEGAAG
ncbi:MAG: hypothetical protein ABI679_14910 [Gemmatimonadota bacterium]